MQERSARLTRQYRRSRVMLYSMLLPALALAMTWSGSLQSTWRYAMVVIGFSAIVFVHELGHFLVARACSVKCLAFSIGIGPRVVGWRKGGKLSVGKDPYDPDNTKEGSTSTSEKTRGEKEDEKYASKPLDSATGVTVQTEKGAVEIQPDTPNLTADIMGQPHPGVIEKIEAATVHSDILSSAKAFPHPPEVGDCDYRISLLPLGGYVRMLGQDDMDPTKVSDDPHAFNRRPIWQRMCIVSAGVIMNLICAAVIFSIVFHPSIGVMFPPAQVGNVQYGAPAFRKGLQLGDRIVSIGGRKPLGFVEFADLVIESALSDGEEEINLEVERPGVAGTIKFEIKPEQLQESGFLAIGVEPMPSLKIAVSGDEPKTGPDALIDEGGKPVELHRGDQILQVNGQAVEDYVALQSLLRDNGAKPLTLTLHNSDRLIADRIVKITPQVRVRSGVEAFSVLGLGPRLAITGASKGKSAEKAGVKAGDIVLKIGERSDPSDSEFKDIVGHNPGRALSLEVERDGKPVSLTVTPEDAKGKGLMGVGIAPDDDSTVVAVRDRNSAAVDTGIFQGSDPVRLSAIDGTPVHNWANIIDLLRQRKAGESMTLTFKSDQQETTRTLALSEAQVKDLHEKTMVRLGLNLELQQQLQKAASPGQAVLMGLEHTKKFILQVYMTLAGMVRQTVSVDNLHGPLAIAKVGADVQERGQVWLWYLMAMVSVNLAVANFLPLPIVDGGLFLLLILEKIRGRPLSIKTQTVIQTAGIVLLAGVFLFVTLHNDIPFLVGR